MAHLQQNNQQEERLITGFVAEKKGYLYWVLNVYEDGKRKPKWIPTKMKAKGNKTRTKDMLPDIRREWTQKLGQRVIDSKSSLAPVQEEDQKVFTEQKPYKDMLFLDWLYMWLDYKYKQATQQTLSDKQIDLTTYAGYAENMRYPIAPYFEDKGFTLSSITKDDIKAFYNAQLQRDAKHRKGKVSSSTVKHYHAVIHGALNYAIDEGLLMANPADRIFFPKQKKFKGSYYHHEEALQLFGFMQGTKIEIPIMLASFYGMRRSEVLGLKWDAFDFKYGCFTVQHTVTACTIDGKHQMVKKDKTKTKSSTRTYPMIPYIKERLLEIKEQQDYYKQLCGNSYMKEYDGYVCVDEIGDLLKPGYVTNAFPQLLKKHELRHIRFHDLRHTCAALLLANGVPMERIQEWLGHSEIGTTTDIYGHLEYITKVASAETMESVFNMQMMASLLPKNAKAETASA